MEPTAAFLELMLALARVGTAFFMLPIVGPEIMPPLARVAAAVPFALFAAGTGLAAGGADPGLAVFLKEIVVGMLLGFAWALPFHAMETVGEWIDYQAGLTFTQTVDPFSGNSTSVSATLVSRLVAMLFIAAGGFTLLLDTLYLSYRLWPAHAPLPALGPGTLGLLLAQQQGLLALALLFAAPVALVLLLVDFAAGLVSSTAKNMDIERVVLPLKLGLAWLVLLLCLPYVQARLVSLLPELVALSRALLAP